MLFTVCLGNATNNFSSQTPPRHTDIISTPCTITVPTTGYRIQMYMQVLLIFFFWGGVDKKNIASSWIKKILHRLSFCLQVLKSTQ